MTENVQKIWRARQDAEKAAAATKEQLRLAVEGEAKVTLPAGMKIVGLEVEYETCDSDRAKVFYAAVPVDFVTKGIRGYKFSDQRGWFDRGTPAGMLVFNEDDYSSTWLQWQAWKKAFEDFDL